MSSEDEEVGGEAIDLGDFIALLLGRGNLGRPTAPLDRSIGASALTYFLSWLQHVSGEGEGNRHENELRQRDALGSSDFRLHLTRDALVGSPKPRNMNSWVTKRRAHGLFSRAQRAHVGGRFVPNARDGFRFRGMGRIYSGQFSQSGKWMVLANQRGEVTVLDMSLPVPRMHKNIIAQDIRWTITSTDTTPDERFLVYTTISDVVHLCNITGDHEIHERLVFSEDHDEFGFGIWCSKFSAGGQELVAGCSDSSIVVYDVERKRPVVHMPAHDDDINAVTFADRAYKPHVIVSGSDDHLVKVWDRRTMRSEGMQQAAAYLPGHASGITSLSSKGDGNYILSNGKDQTAKLWDLRRAYSSTAFEQLPRVDPPCRFDYRTDDWPMWGSPYSHPHDASVMTYRGHEVLQTLIRAYFSPAATTGQQYIYSGSSDGYVYVWDALSGEIVHRLAGHRSVVRDVSWHPTRPLLVSSSWDRSVLFRTVARPGLAEAEETGAAAADGAGGGGGSDDDGDDDLDYVPEDSDEEDLHDEEEDSSSSEEEEEGADHEAQGQGMSGAGGNDDEEDQGSETDNEDDPNHAGSESRSRKRGSMRPDSALEPAASRRRPA